MQEKTRKLIFNLALPFNQKELPIPLMLARGYSKPDVIACFEILEASDFGIFDRGAQGRGNVGKFIPNEKFPQEYMIEFDIKKPGRPKRLLTNNED